ncbi:MAG TPA: isoprenylcysteine carboxylmethyltransferase family protein [Thermoanaerobaculia bacterium]|nr:isoprenylcysteine carboxylmethyltransferase family protein [Thermoanaerobaculia bacterium]
MQELGVSTFDRLHTLQCRGTRVRLLASRAFGAAVLVLLLLGSNYWDHANHILFEETLFILGILLTVLGFLGRLWCLAYISGRKKRELVVTGPYSLCRHPLYLCSLIGGVGLGLCTETLTAPLLIAVAFAVYYPAVIRTEERFLAENFAGYAGYRRRVPLFFPRWSAFVDESALHLNSRAFRRELIGAGAVVPLIGAIELIEALHQAAWLPSYFLIP